MIRSLGDKTPKIAKSAFVSEAAYVIGEVEIGEHSSVWPGAVIRADFGSIKIGQNTAIEDNCVIHSGSPTKDDYREEVVIGDNVHIGHGAVLNCRQIGNSVLIGMNATVLHDVEIGNLCVIAAGCLVGEGMKVPDGSLVAGVPGRIKGKATEKQLWWVKHGPPSYVELAKEYKKLGL
ncbi:MAG: gamma carbonic anhydrase family protein [Dehalococcoidia bacterium]|jgi:carbonic anhydrase/acetyltransferase-like protein (isoleucine patch superfamily)